MQGSRDWKKFRRHSSAGDKDVCCTYVMHMHAQFLSAEASMCSVDSMLQSLTVVLAMLVQVHEFA
jgi:hypothetical protein